MGTAGSRTAQSAVAMSVSARIALTPYNVCRRLFDAVGSAIGPQYLRDRDRPVSLLIVFDQRHENTRCGDRGRVQGVCEAHDPLGIAVADIQAPRLEVVEEGGGADLAVGPLARYPQLNVVFLDLS